MAANNNTSATSNIAQGSKDLGPAIKALNAAVGVGASTTQPQLDSIYTTSKQGLMGGVVTVFDTQSGITYAGVNGVLLGDSPCLEYVYEPAKDGGTSGQNYLLRGVPIPANFIIEDASFHVSVAFVGAGASISIGTSTFLVGSGTLSGLSGASIVSASATNLYGVTALATFGTVGKKQGIPDFATAGDALAITTESLPVIAVSGGNLTAGKLSLILRGRIVNP